MCSFRLCLKLDIIFAFFVLFGSLFQVSAPEKDTLVWNRSIRENGLIKLGEPYLIDDLQSKASR